MTLSFSNPNALLLIIPMCAAVLIISFYYKKYRTIEQKIKIIIRCTLIILLVFAASEAEFNFHSRNTETIFAVDMSASLREKKAEIISFINNSLKNKSKNDLVGAVSFAETADIEAVPSSSFNSYSPHNDIKPDGSDIKSVLQLSSAIFSDNAKKRTVLISDGNETGESALAAAKKLKENSIIVDTLYIDDTPDKEVQINNISVPKYISKSSDYSIKISLQSNCNTQAVLTVYKQENLAARQNINVTRGENSFFINDKADIGGNITLRAEIEPIDDTYIQNNIMYTYSYVNDTPYALIIENNGSGSLMSSILENSGIAVETVSANAAPSTAEAFNAYDLVIISNCSTDMLPNGTPDALENYVNSLGGGVLATGGQNAFALGGYADTPLEKLLPINMELKDQNENGQLGLVLVLDRSGSMNDGKYGVTKMNMAKQAAVSSIQTLNKKDFAGIIAFDNEPVWVSELGEINSDIEKKINSISPGGGTSMLPALEMAYSALESVDTKLKHIILLTDGQAENGGYDSFINNINNSGITLSAVAVGSDSDTMLLSYLAQEANGRYYYTDEFSDLPQIFASETDIAGKKYINEEYFYPTLNTLSDLSEGAETVPALGGYIAATPKNRSDVILSTSDDIPVAAVWQYGAGRSAAWTPDVERWCGEWFDDKDGTAIFSNILSWTMRTHEPADYDIFVDRIAGKTRLTLFTDSDKLLNISAVLSRGNTEENIDFSMLSPGKYEAYSTMTQEGSYFISLHMNSADGEINSFSGLSIPYSKEYDIRNNNGLKLMQDIASATDGRIIENDTDIFYALSGLAFEKKSASRILLALAILLLLIDIAVRRFGLLHFKSFIIKKEKKSTKVFKNNSKYVYNISKDTKTSHNENIDNNIEKNNKKAEEASTSSILLSGKKKRSGNK